MNGGFDSILLGGGSNLVKAFELDQWNMQKNNLCNIIVYIKPPEINF